MEQQGRLGNDSALVANLTPATDRRVIEPSGPPLPTDLAEILVVHDD